MSGLNERSRGTLRSSLRLHKIRRKKVDVRG